MWFLPPSSPAATPEIQDEEPTAPAPSQQALPPRDPNAPVAGNEPAVPSRQQQPEKQETPASAPEYLALAESLYENPAGEFSGIRGEQAEEPAKDSVRLAAEAFVDGDYRQALNLAGAVSGVNASYWTARRIAAHSAFLLRNYSRAVALFGEISSAAPPSFAEEAEGNLLLAYLAAGQEKAAGFVTLLEKLVGDEGHPFHERAVGIRDGLR